MMNGPLMEPYPHGVRTAYRHFACYGALMQWVRNDPFLMLQVIFI